DSLADFEVFPSRPLRHGAAAAQHQQAFARVIAIDEEIHLLPDGRLFGIDELKTRDDSLALATEVDKDVVLVDLDNFPSAGLLAPTFGRRGGRLLLVAVQIVFRQSAQRGVNLL